MNEEAMSSPSSSEPPSSPLPPTQTYTGFWRWLLLVVQSMTTEPAKAGAEGCSPDHELGTH